MMVGRPVSRTQSVSGRTDDVGDMYKAWTEMKPVELLLANDIPPSVVFNCDGPKFNPGGYGTSIAPLALAIHLKS